MRFNDLAQLVQGFAAERADLFKRRKLLFCSVEVSGQQKRLAEVLKGALMSRVQFEGPAVIRNRRFQVAEVALAVGEHVERVRALRIQDGRFREAHCGKCPVSCVCRGHAFGVGTVTGAGCRRFRAGGEGDGSPERCGHGKTHAASSCCHDILPFARRDSDPLAV